MWALCCALLSVLLLGATCRRNNSPQPDPPDTVEGVDSCRDQLAYALKRVEVVEPAQRATTALSALSKSCIDVLGPLGIAAREAATMPRGPRAQLLAAAAADALPPACATSTPLAPAAGMIWSCPPPDGMQLAEHLLKDLDTGTYLFAIAVRARLGYAELLDAKADRLLKNMIMGAALEGEAARSTGTGGAD